ncbi:hypothetical protein D3C71_1736890 [compost metagenome]
MRHQECITQTTLLGDSSQSGRTNEALDGRAENAFQRGTTFGKTFQGRTMLLGDDLKIVCVLAAKRLTAWHPFGIVIKQQLQHAQACINAKLADVHLPQHFQKRR